MSKRMKLIIAIGSVVALLALIVPMTVSARGPIGGLWGRGPKVGVPQSAGLEAIAEALGMTTEDLRAALKGGKTLADLAEEKGVALSALRDAANASQQAAVREAIEKAVSDGKLTREQADWMLQGLDKGYTMGGHRGPGWFGPFRGGPAMGDTGLEAAAKALNMTVDELSLQLWGGRTLADLAERAGVKLEDVQSAVEASRQAAMEQAIEQAVTDGQITREQADWLLEGLKNGYGLRGRFPGMGGLRVPQRFPRGVRPSRPNQQPAPSGTSTNTSI